MYWIPLYEMLDAAGFEVHLVNARHVRSVPGRKSDVMDCQWLQQLMSYGLLRGGFRPAESICALRAVWRHRDMLLSYQARHVQHLQKAMTQMNVQLHHVISDIMGVTGQAIVRAIVAGARDASVLAKLRDRRIKADEAQIAAALQGNWRDEHLFALSKISGGKVLSGATKPCANRAAQALRMAAQALRKSQTALGAHHRRLCSRMDRPKAITASAHKLARLVYFMLTKGQAFVEAGQEAYEAQQRLRMLHNLTKRAREMGFELKPREPVPT